MENIISDEEGITVKHSRCKQRSDKKGTAFFVPRLKDGVNFASYVDQYLNGVKAQISKVSGRAFWRGNDDCYMNQPVGRNMIGAIPFQMAEVLSKEDPKSYTFHSFRRTAATAAADSGATPQQLQDFFGWKNVTMASEYVSTSTAALKTMAKHLTGGSNKKDTNIESASSSSLKSTSSNDLGDISNIFPSGVSKIVIMQNVQNVNM